MHHTRHIPYYWGGRLDFRWRLPSCVTPVHLCNHQKKPLQSPFRQLSTCWKQDVCSKSILATTLTRSGWMPMNERSRIDFIWPNTKGSFPCAQSWKVLFEMPAAVYLYESTTSAAVTAGVAPHHGVTRPIISQKMNKHKYFALTATQCKHWSTNVASVGISQMSLTNRVNNTGLL